MRSRVSLFWLLVLSLTCPLAAAGSAVPDAGPDVSTKAALRPQGQALPPLVKRAIERQPLTFVAQPGANGASRYLAHGGGYLLSVEPARLTLRAEKTIPAEATKAAAADAGLHPSLPAPRVEQHEVSIDFLNTDPHTNLSALDQATAHFNYFKGNDPALWQHNLPTYGRLRATSLYPGIDLTYYGQDNNSLEYDLVVAPHADPGQIRFKVSGDKPAVIDAEGNLSLDGTDGTMRLLRPMLYQDVDHGKRAIAGGFVELADHEFGFRPANYDHDRPLVIDPQINLLYATYAGGLHNDVAYDMAVDANGNAYVVGYTASEDFPVSANGYQTERRNIGTYTYDIAVMKFDPSGTLLYSTLLGGSDSEAGYSIVVNPDGSVYVGGYTQSTDFPVTSNAYQKTWGGSQDVILAKLSSDGSQLLYSTYLGGSRNEGISSMLLNADGSLWVAGTAAGPGLPASSGAYQPAPKGTDTNFVAKFSFDKNGELQIPALTFLGGSNASEEASGGNLAVDSSGNVYLAGGTQSADFPVTANAYEKPFALSGGCINSPLPNSITALSKFNPDLTKLLYSTVLGGHTENQNGYPVCNQYARSIQVDGNGNIWLVGATGMSDFPTTSNALSTQLNGNGSAGVDLFITEFSADGTKLLYSTYFGGSQWDYSPFSAWDAAGNLWITATSQSTDFPVTANALQPKNGGGYDTTITEFSPTSTKVLYATYLGGLGDEDISGTGKIRIDAQGGIHLSGATTSANYPVTANAAQSAFADADSGADGNDIYYSILGSGVLGVVTPVGGGNLGDDTISLEGAGFASGATCKLVSGSTTYTASQVVIIADGTKMSCTFALNGAQVGSYDVVVTNPDGTAITKQGGYTVAAGTGPAVWVNVNGRSTVRYNTPDSFQLTYGNTGDTDAYLVPVWIVVPPTVTLSYSPFYPPQPNGSTVDYSKSPQTFQLDGNTVAQLIIPRIPAGSSYSLPLTITAGSDLTDFDVTVYTTVQPYASSATDISSQVAQRMSQAGAGRFQREIGARPAASTAGACLNDILSALLNAAGLGGGGCAIAIYNGLSSVIAQSFDNAIDGNYAAPINWNALGTDFLSSAGAECTQAVLGKIPGLNLAFALWNAAQAYNDCMPYLKPLLPKPKKPVKPKGAKDPNEISGTDGAGDPDHFVTLASPLTYNVAFENTPTASLPAANVVVTNQLDPTKVDLSSLTLNSIQIGGAVSTLPAGVNNYNAVLSVPSEPTLNVRVEGSLDTNSGLLKWTFTTLDASTKLPPTDPTVGFLPPDSDGIKGQGSMVFTVRPKGSLTTNTQIPDQASVVFDQNAPIQTATWVNTIDVDAPTSAVTALPAAQADSTINVAWSGKDNGSGIATYDVYVQDNGGSFSLWQSATSALTANFTGTTGHTYGFYSIATDAVGNVEPAKSVADTSIRIGATPDFTVTATPAITVQSGSSGSATITITPQGGFNSAVSFACSGLPSEAACSFSPVTVTPSSGAATTTLTIKTTAASSAIRPAGGAIAGMFALLLLGRTRRKLRSSLIVLCLLTIGLALTACGGSSHTDPGTPQGTSTVKVTATAGSVSHSVDVTLTVQ